MSGPTLAFLQDARFSRIVVGAGSLHRPRGETGACEAKRELVRCTPGIAAAVQSVDG